MVTWSGFLQTRKQFLITSTKMKNNIIQLPVTNNHCLKLWYIDDYIFDKSIFYLFSNVLSVIMHSLSRNNFTLTKSNFFTSISKSVITYITLTVTNISNNMIKQYYGIVKTFKALVIVKRNSLAELIFLFRTGLSRLISKLYLVSKLYLWCSYAKMVNSSKDGILLKIRRWSRIALSFDGLTFLNVKGDIPICSPDLTFKYLSVSP